MNSAIRVGTMSDIPRIIHQTWKDNHLPTDYKQYRQTILDLHPDWEHRLWTDADNRNLIMKTFPWFLKTYDNYKHTIERVDAVRYFILLHYGGVYIDLDMECLKPVDDLFLEGNLHFSLLASPSYFFISKHTRKPIPLSKY